ncbi:hypothetical protein EU245_03775 [Lentibacillus lipolyticus]|nr:hypothetical protein EU245_03775 [Lentibacillus lipolyticus]
MARLARQPASAHFIWRLVMKAFRLMLALGIICILISCSADNNKPNTQSGETEFKKITASDTSSQSISNQAKEKLKKREGITSIYAVNTDKKLVIAFEIKHHKRFQLASTRKDVHKQMEKAFPDYEAEVSTDKRIVLDLKELEKKVDKGKLSKKQLKKEMKQLVQLMKDKT